MLLIIKLRKTLYSPHQKKSSKKLSGYYAYINIYSLYFLYDDRKTKRTG